MRKSSVEGRKITALESFKSASNDIGKITFNMNRFIVTRGQWSMIDAILHALDEVGKSEISLWTWTVAEYEIQTLTRLMTDKRISSGTLVIYAGARNKNAGLIRDWKNIFGADSVRYVANHAKICTISSDSGHKLLLRGSMNLNFNPRFEQFDISENCDGYGLVKSIEAGLTVLNDDCNGGQVWEASRVSEAFDKKKLDLFRGVKVWAK